MKPSTTARTDRETPFGRRTRRSSERQNTVPEAEAVAAREAAARLAKSPIFADVSPGRLARLARGAVMKRLRAGEIMWHGGEPAQYVAVVQSGLLRLGRPNAEGEAYSYGIFGPGEMVGLYAALDDGVYPSDATAVNNTVEVIKIPAEVLLDSMRRDPQVGMAVCRALMQFTATLRAKIEIISAGPVPNRIASLMLYLVSRFGQMQGNHAAFLPLPLTREQIGELVGARFETVIRTLSQWDRAGWFRTTSEGFELLRLDMLRRVLEN